MTVPIKIDFGMLRFNSPLDATGAVAQVTYTPPGGTAQTSGVDLEYCVPYMRMVFDVVESLTSEAQAAKCVGYTNSATWRGYAPNTCLCLCVDGVALGSNFENFYYIAYHSQNWNVSIPYRNLVGQIPSDVTTSNGIGNFKVFPQIDFNTAIPNVT